jgi:hypothetical protein
MPPEPSENNSRGRQERTFRLLKRKGKRSDGKRNAAQDYGPPGVGQLGVRDFGFGLRREQAQSRDVIELATDEAGSKVGW